ncbi:MAG: hypothetical protein FWC50_06570 [Planctomycetaceae bacterium]|nr:hypothetical protein [Planctomycetaceae bacterium]
MFRLTFSPIFDSYFLVAVLTLAMASGVWFFRLDNDRVSRKRRIVLMSLRWGSVFLIFFAMLRPAIVFLERVKLPATLVILVDQSESMSIADEMGGRSRYDVACGIINAASGPLNRLAKHDDVLPFLFDRSVTPLKMEKNGMAFPEKPLGSETAIGFSLQQVLEQTAGKRLLGTILLTDGTQRTRPPYDRLPQEAAARFRDNGDVLYAVRLGTASGLDEVPDVAVQDLMVNDRVFVNNELLVSGQLRVRGYANRSIPVTLLFETTSGEMSEVSRQELRVTEPMQLIPFQFRYVPKTPGLFKVTVSVPVQPNELLETNNAQSGFVRVMGGGLSVLHLEGTWRIEQKYLRMALDSSPDIQVNYIRVPTGQQGLLLNELQPGKHAVFILGDIDSTAFTREELEALASRVREGAGLIMLGGFHTFGAGGYYDTPLADLSPVVMSKLDRQSPDGPIRSDLHLDGEVFLVPTQLGQLSYLLRLSSDPQSNLAIWKSLPPFQGINRLTVKPAAQVLATASSETGTDAKYPILVTQLAGSGRVIAFAADSTWIWPMHGFANEHKRFWRQIVLWLAKYDELSEGDCWVELDRTRFLPGETVTFRVRVKAKTGEEIASPNVTAFVQTGDGPPQPVALVDENGVMTGSFRETQQPGDYLITATATTEHTASENVPGNHDTSTPADGKGEKGEVKTGTARFLVIDKNIELDHPVASPMVLENIATMTGGKTVAPEQFPQLLDEIAGRSTELVEHRETKRTLYDNWPFFLLFVTCLSVDWFLRKRWGIVG